MNIKKQTLASEPHSSFTLEALRQIAPAAFIEVRDPDGTLSRLWANTIQTGQRSSVGSESLTQLREVEKAKIACATKHFASISDGQVKFGVVQSYETLYNKVT